jgi:hypothetical protein
MKAEELAELIGSITDESLIVLPFKDRKHSGKRTVPRFLSRAASVAAAAVLALFISTATAEAAGVRVVTPFVSWTGSTLRLDYSAGLDQHEDAPEITADPSHKPVVSSIPSERIRFTSEEEFKARVGNMIRLPGEGLGLEFVEAKGAFSGDLASISAKYTLNGYEITISSSLHHGIIGTEYSARTLLLDGVYKYEIKEIAGVACDLAYGAPWDYVSIVVGNESYLVFGDCGMTELETIAASMLASK